MEGRPQESGDGSLTLVDYSKMQDDRQFIDLQEENLADNPIQTEKQAKELLMNSLINHKINVRELKNRQNEDLRRDIIIRTLKRKSNLSVRQIANLLEIDRNMVQRTK